MTATLGSPEEGIQASHARRLTAVQGHTYNEQLGKVSGKRPKLFGWDRYMYAIIETGGKQYPVVPGKDILVELLQGDEGSSVEFTNVVAVSQDGGEFLVGDAVKSAKVTGTIASQERAKKVHVLKFKRRKHYRRHIGHRQNYTRIKIGEIVI